MPPAGDVLDLSPIGAIFHVRKTAAETGGASFEMEWELKPRTGGTPIHIHPHATESYKVLEGSLELFVDGRWATLGPGESAAVEPGVPHTFRNSGDEPARVYNVHAPAMRFEGYFSGLHEIVRSGVVSADRVTPKALLYMAVLMTDFQDEIQTVRPPHWVMRMAGTVGRLIGIRIAAFLAATVLSAGCVPAAVGSGIGADVMVDVATLRPQVLEAERAFARTMADRDHEAFVEFLAEDAIFFAGDAAVRGRNAVGELWLPFFQGPDAPFSWEPDQVEVVESGTLALSSGPVYDPNGRVTGRFNSIWRQETPGRWRVVFDKGSPLCACDEAAP